MQTQYFYNTSVLIPVKQSFSFHPSIHVQVLGEEHSIFVSHRGLQIAIAKQTDYMH